MEEKPPKLCQNCGGEITGKRSDALYCSQACRSKACRIRAGQPERTPVTVTLVCKQCEQAFDWRKKNPSTNSGCRPLYCSQSCRSKAWRLRTGRYKMLKGQLCPHCREAHVPQNDPWSGYCNPRCAEQAKQWAEHDGNCPTCGATWTGQTICARCGFQFHESFAM